MNHAQRLHNMANAILGSEVTDTSIRELIEALDSAYKPHINISLRLKNPLYVGDDKTLGDGAVILFKDSSICILGNTTGDEHFLLMEVPITEMPFDARLDFVKSVCAATGMEFGEVLLAAFKQTSARKVNS